MPEFTAQDGARLHYLDEGEGQPVLALSGLTRKYTIPIMEYFDRTGLTVRVGDHRVLRKSS